MSPINATNCYYYTKEESPVDTGDATAKSVDEFVDGTVAALLGKAFVDGTEYPVIGTFPADYTKVDAAIEEAGLLNKEEYKNYNAVEDAINAVVRGKTIAEQTTVDGYAAAIENAINALEYKDADYTKVDAAIDKANALNKNDYKDFSGVEAASRLLSVVKILRAGVGATVGNAAAAGVADGYLADRALVAGDEQHLHLGGVAGMSAHGHLHPLGDDGPFLVDAAAHGGLGTGNDGFRYVQQPSRSLSSLARRATSRSTLYFSS